MLTATAASLPELFKAWISIEEIARDLHEGEPALGIDFRGYRLGMMRLGLIFVLQMFGERLGEDLDRVRALLGALDDRRRDGVDKRLWLQAELGELLVSIEPLFAVVPIFVSDEAGDLQDLADRLVVVDEPGQVECLLLAIPTLTRNVSSMTFR